MNRLQTATLAALLSLSPITFAADAPKPEDLAKQLTEGTSTAKTPADFDAAYASALPPLLLKPEADDTTLQRLAFRASRPGAEVERAALSRALASKLQTESTPAARVLLLRHIGRIGRDETVPAVAALLGDKDEHVRDSARRALANIPTKPAADALRAAIDKAEDAKWRGALIAALAHRRDAADAPLFAALSIESDDAVRLPALAALARTGDATAARVIAAARDGGSDAAKAAAHDAYLLLADRLIALDQRPAAARIYREYLFSPQRYRYAGIVGLGQAGTEEDVPKILNLLADKDPQARGAALQALAARRDPGTGNEIMSRLAKADATAKPWLIRALMAQGDRRVGKVLTDAASDADEAVRVQAVSGLARFGDAGAVPLLLKSAAAKGEEQTAARNALETIPANGVDDALLDRVAAGETPQRVEAIRALGVRQTAAAVDLLFKAATDAESAVRSEAQKSLALIAPIEALPRAVQSIVSAKEDADRDAAAKTAVAIARKSEDVDARTAPVLAEINKAEGSTRAALLNVAGQLGGEKAMAAIRAAIADADGKTHEAGVRALTNWPDAAPLGDLLALAKDEKNTTLSVLSLRGYVRIAGLPNKRPAAETVKLYADAMAVAKRPDEKKMILGGLGELKDPKALEAVAPYLSDEALSAEACAAAVKLARDTWEKNKDLARTTMTKVLEVSKNDGQKKTAKETLEKITPPAKAP